MAFSPFNFFRRNQKAIFAVITVFIMFTFVLSSGLGGGADFFDWFPRWLGGSGARGPHLCTIDGERIYDREVREARFNRVMANRFMMYASSQTSAVLRRDIQEKLVQVPPRVSNTIRPILEGKGDPRMFEFVVAGMMMNPAASPAEKQLANVLRAWVEVEKHKQIAEITGVYFANAPNKTARDVVEFMMWERKADRMGITFTEGDVKALVRREFFEQFQSDVEIREVMSREYSGRFTLNAVLKALATEFKVRTAQTALLGSGGEGAERTLSYPPVFNTPFDMFAAYKDKTNPAEYRVLALPAASFATKVTAEPTEADLRRLFAERKDYEPDPSKEEFGFKEPRKLKVEWAAASGDEPYYQKAAAEWARLSEFFLKNGASALTVPTPGVGPAAWAGEAFGPTAAKEPLLSAAYRFREMQHDQSLSFKWSEANRVLPLYLLDSSFGMWSKRAERTKADVDAKRPVYAAGPELAAQLTALGAAGIGGSPLIQPSAFYAQAVAHESRARGVSGGLLFLAGTPGLDVLGKLVGAEAGYRQSLPKAIPLDAVRGELLAEMSQRKARDLAAADLLRLQTELVRLGENGKARDKGAAAKAFAADFLKERGLKTGSTADPVSEWTIRDDPGLAPLREAFAKASGPEAHAGMSVPFGQKFFSSLDPLRGTRATASGLYVPDFYPEQALKMAAATKEPIYLAWRTEDEAAKALPFEKARPRVVEAWKRAKGREEAKAAAEAAAARIRNVPGTDPSLFYPQMVELQAELRAKFDDPKAKEQVKLFRLDNVAPVQVLNDANGMARPFTLRGNADIPFPTVEIGKRLLDERTSPGKTVFVLPDGAKDVYYVFALSGRQERGVEEFRAHLYTMAGRGMTNELVRSLQAEDARERVKKSVLGLLKKEFDYKETDEQKVLLDERDRKGDD